MAPKLTTRVKEIRQRLGWSQSDLALRSGLSRAGVSAIEVGRLVPSAAAALALAEALECKVEDLFALRRSKPPLASPWAWPPGGERARYWIADVGGRRLRYPVEHTPLGQIPPDGVDCVASSHEQTAREAPGTIVMACCDPAVGLLAAQLMRQASVRVLVLQRSSTTALTLLRDGFVHAAGVHLAAVGDRGGNVGPVRELLGAGYQLLRVANWDEGVATRPEHTSFRIDRPRAAGLRWVARDAGSGAHHCMTELFAGAQMPKRVAHDHRTVSTLIRGGWADAGVCLRLVAEEAGLRFHALRTEPYDLCVSSRSLADPRIKQLIQVVRSSDYRQLVAELPGYDASQTGVLQNISARS